MSRPKPAAGASLGGAVSKAPVVEPVADAGDAKAVWARVEEAAAASSSLAWVDLLRLVSIGDGVAVVGARPSKRDAVRFLSMSNHRQRLTDLISAAVGSRVEVRVEAGRTDPGERPAAGRSGPGQDDVREALDGPGVKMVMEVFPDASIMNIRKLDAGGGDDEETV